MSVGVLLSHRSSFFSTEYTGSGANLPSETFREAVPRSQYLTDAKYVYCIILDAIYCILYIVYCIILYTIYEIILYTIYEIILYTIY